MRTAGVAGCVRSVVGVALVIGVAAAPTSAAVLCKGRSGIVVVRPMACKRKESALDLAQFGAVGPPGAPGRDFAVDTTLPSGSTEVGVFAGGQTLDAAPTGATEITLLVSFRIPLAASIPEANAIRVSGVGGSALHCPGQGHADRGYFCLYETFNYGSATFTEFDNSIDGIGGISPYGTSLLYNAVGRRNVISGTWAVTAP